ncbi:MAG: 50S ribosomal protein L15 [Candidatus Magasanikbacteria bacterium]|jgi:large subunit ribosomal protein L15|nr:50S ribosomal protein L15 [Candidatus Magasanikbacteria bacterium]
MALSAHTITSTGTAKQTSRRVGRGNGSTKGTTAGRGQKGQKARSGGKSGAQRRGFKAALQKIPKLRGFNSIHPKKETVTLAMISRACNNGDIISPALLTRIGLIEKPQRGVKIVNRGTLDKKVSVKGCLISKGALAAIEKAGGSVQF